MNVWNPMEDVNTFVRTLMEAIHVHVVLDMYLEWMITIVKVLYVYNFTVTVDACINTHWWIITIFIVSTYHNYVWDNWNLLFPLWTKFYMQNYVHKIY